MLFWYLKYIVTNTYYDILSVGFTYIYTQVLGNVECLDEAMPTVGTSTTHTYEHHYLVWYLLSVNGKFTQAVAAEYAEVFRGRDF